LRVHTLFPRRHLQSVNKRVKSLRTLDISKNKLKNLGQISRLSELKTLKCDENALGINALHSLSNLSKLQILTLGNNRLHYPDPSAASTSHQSFPTLPSNVKQLKLNSNAFSSIPLQICDRRLSLEKLDLSHNNLAAIPPEICNLSE
jgi:Leucine-rich repeat (LRR) protein